MNMGCMIILIIGLNFRLYSFSNISEDIGKMCVNSVPFIMGIPLYLYVS